MKPRDLAKFLRAKGFVLDHVSGSHFVFYHPDQKRRAVVPTHHRDIPKGTFFSILREAGHEREDVLNFFR